MKLLKYILLFIFSLLLNTNVSATEVGVIKSQNAILINNTNAFWSTKLTKLSNDLVYAPPAFRIKILNNLQLIEAWEVLDDAGVDDLIRKNIDEVEFVDDFVKNNPNKTKAQVTADINTQGYSAWKLANAGSDLIDDALSAILKSHPNFSKLGLSASELDEFKLLLNTKMPNSASDIFGGLKSHLDAGTSFENMQQMISGLKNDWGNFSDGSKWVFNYISSTKGLTQFGGKKIRFELPTNTELGLRRIDVADVTNPTNIILYEFKSVQTPFNSTYAAQFVKDLSEANSLSQIKWLYDGAKVNSFNKTQILNLIENSTIPQSTITKYLPGVQNATKADLVDLIDADFDNIFKIINL